VLEEMAGNCRITATTVERSASRHLTLHNSTGRLELVIEKSTFSETATPHGQHGILVSAAGDASLNLQVRDSVIARTFSHGLEITAQDHAVVTARVTGNTFEKNASAISIAVTEAAQLDYVIADNPSITGSSGAAINVYLGVPSTGLLSGTIARNVIGRSGVPRSGAACDTCSGISLRSSGEGSLIARVTGNEIQQVGGGGIHATASQGGSQLNLTATANLLRQESSSSAPAIRVQSGTLADDHTRVCADLGGTGVNANTIQGTWDPNGAIHLIHRFGGAALQIAGLTGGRDEAAAATAVAARNGGVRVRAVLRPDSAEKGFEPAERCTMPALTP
jgi:Right handed beta helix region